MNTFASRRPFVLSAVICVLAAAASVGGLVVEGLYRDNPFVTSASRAADAVTLAIALPLLALGMAYARRGSMRARLVWLAMLDYMLYDYAFYLFGSAFNAFFLIYTGIVALSILALIFALADVDPREIARRFSPRTPARSVAMYMFVVATGLTVIYLIQSVNFIATGTLPPIVTISGHPTSVVFALDLTLLVPWLLIGGAWLWKRRPWGFVIASIVCMKGAVYTLVLAVGSLMAANAGVSEASAETPLWVILTVAGTVASLLLLLNVRPADRPVESPIPVNNR